MEFELAEAISFWCSEYELQFIHPDLQSCLPDLLVSLFHPLIGG